MRECPCLCMRAMNKRNRIKVRERLCLCLFYNRGLLLLFFLSSFKCRGGGNDVLAYFVCTALEVVPFVCQRKFKDYDLILEHVLGTQRKGPV